VAGTTGDKMADRCADLQHSTRDPTAFNSTFVTPPSLAEVRSYRLLAPTVSPPNRFRASGAICDPIRGSGHASLQHFALTVSPTDDCPGRVRGPHPASVIIRMEVPHPLTLLPSKETSGPSVVAEAGKERRTC
jgi:hypothetical protein